MDLDSMIYGNTVSSDSEEPLTIDKIRDAMKKLTPLPIPADIKVGSYERFKKALEGHGVSMPDSKALIGQLGSVPVKESHLVPKDKAVIMHGDGSMTVIDLPE